jgi:hypothetical protein
MNNMESPQPNADIQNPEVVFGEKTQKEVLNELGAILQDTYRMGANDSEIPKIRAIIELFKNGEYVAEEAIRDALEIKNSKQDYH